MIHETLNIMDLTDAHPAGISDTTTFLNLNNPELCTHGVLNSQISVLQHILKNAALQHPVSLGICDSKKTLNSGSVYM